MIITLSGYLLQYYMGKKIIKKEDIDIILSRSTPIASHIVGLILKSKLNLPWIADFSDPWTLSPFISSKIPILHNLEQSLEKRVLSKADKVVVTTGRYRDIVIKHFENIPDIDKKIIVIPNSYDPEDFDGVNLKRSPKEHRFLTMTYMGRFYGSRRPNCFFESLGLLKKDYKSLNIKVNIIGGSDRDNESLEILAEQHGVKELLRILPPVSHHETFTHLANSDVLLLIDAPSDRESIFLPMKLLEYLAVEKPILALTPLNGESADIIRATRTGTVVAPTDIPDIKNAIEDYYQAYLKSELSITPDLMEIEKYCIQTNVVRLVSEMNILIEE
jgi:glycosyltransferase involved in cell wall biosynthesis